MRVTPEILHGLQANTERIRNICIIAHVDHGKTTLSDSLVSANGIISEKLAGKIRYLDNTEEEQIRGITMKSSAISLMFQNEPLNTTPTGQSQDEVDGETQEQEEPYLINLVDSPGHVDFSFDVSTAVRLCDGALVLVDVVEGVCAQTHAVLRQAWQEGIRPCLVINKIDRLILELQFTPFEAYQRINRILEQANAIISSLIRAEVLQSLEGQQDDDFNTDIHERVTEKEKELLFSPSNGNVMFASAYDGWAFAIGFFAQLYAKKLALSFRILRQALWGEFYYQTKTKKILTKPFASNAQPMFVTFILEPIWHAYTTLNQPLNTEKDMENICKLTRQLRVAKVVQDRDLKHPERKNAIQAVMRKWLPLAPNVLKMVTRALPNPIIAQQKRALTLCGASKSLVSYEINAFHALEKCQTSAESPVIGYVCKMISVEAGLLSNFHQVAGQLGITERSQEVFVAITRVFSGVLYAGKPLYVFGPKFQGLTSIQAANIDQLDLTQVEHVTQVASGLTKLYMLMGRELHALEKVPAGNIVGIIGLQDHVLKTATLSSTLKCPSLAKMPYQAKPIVRVAIEPEDPRNFEELEAGLQRLYRSDPTVEVQVQATGEHVIVALGELHLERCIKDLKERFAKVAVRVSPPLVGFRESILDGKISSLQESVVFKDILAAALEEKTSTDDQDDNEREDSTKDVKIAKGRTPDTSVTLKVRALPLPLQVSKLLEEHVDILRQLTSQQNLASTSERKIHEKEEQEEEMDISESAGVAASAEFSSGVNNLKKQLQQAFNSSEETFWHQLSLEKIWCFGPRRIGPNVLINNVDGYLASNSVFLALEQVAERAYQDQKECFEMLSKLENSLMTGFQLATAAGPLCDEPVWGVAFILEDFVYHPIDQSSAPLLAPVPSADQSSCTQSSSILAPNINNYGPLSGQVISCIKNTCRLAFVKQPVRLVEAIYECTVQCQSEQLGRLYSVINKRRGNVFQEELSDGTSLFTIKASLPVVESFGFATELLINTSGAASNPQLTFSHWSIIEDDPFFQPQTEEEREDYGERIYEHNYVRKYIDAVRKRKGLARDEKIVVHAEKQRTLARKK